MEAKKIKEYIYRYKNTESTGRLFTIAALFVLLNSTCLFFTTSQFEQGIEGGLFSFVKTGEKTDYSTDNDTQKNMSVELEIFQNILRYSDLNHDVAFRLANDIMDNCEKYNVNPYLVLAVIKVESNFQPRAVSSMGARGLMQIMPSTAKYISRKFDFKYSGSNSLFNPHANVKMGIAYLSLLDQRYNDIEHVLWAYNYGPARYQALKKSLGNSLPYYVKQVMSFKSFLESESVLVSES